ncbi:hypothetical protein BH11BAC1_BH11BAC1_16500 [soil metagenome]
MNVKIIDAEMRPLELNSGVPYSKENLIRQRLLNLSGTVLFANREKADFLVVHGAIHDLLKVSVDDLQRTGNILSTFKGEAVLIASDVYDDVLEKFKPYINKKKVFIMPEDTNKCIPVTDALRIIASVDISEVK